MHFALVFVEDWFAGEVFGAFVALEGPDIEMHFVLMRLQVWQLSVGVLALRALVELPTPIPTGCAGDQIS